MYATLIKTDSTNSILYFIFIDYNINKAYVDKLYTLIEEFDRYIVAFEMKNHRYKLNIKNLKSREFINELAELRFEVTINIIDYLLPELNIDPTDPQMYFKLSQYFTNIMCPLFHNITMNENIIDENTHEYNNISEKISTQIFQSNEIPKCNKIDIPKNFSSYSVSASSSPLNISKINSNNIDSLESASNFESIFGSDTGTFYRCSSTSTNKSISRATSKETVN